MLKLEKLPEIQIREELYDHYLVVEYREINELGTPIEDWAEWAAIDISNPRVLYPEKNSRVTRYIKDMCQYFTDMEQNIEYRIKLQKCMTRTEDISVTKPWMHTSKMCTGT